jgi:hypothetical protein
MEFVNKWMNGELSNFQYFIKLNILSGRSFSEASLYPEFSWILRDDTSDRIDLRDPQIYRDLSLPMGVLTEQRLVALRVHRSM